LVASALAAKSFPKSAHRREIPGHGVVLIEAPPIGPTLVGKPEERKRFRFLLSPPASGSGRKPAKLQQARLFRMKFQSELA
jgi:hypothetical protein